MRRSWTTGWRVLAVAIFCALSMPGCSSVQSSGIDPTGEHLFATPPPPTTAAAVPVVAPVSPYPPNERYFDDPLGPLPWDDVAVLIEPRELVAPVGSEVVVIAGVLGPDGFLRTNRRLEWSITPGSVGQFVSVEPGGFTDLLLGDFTWPHIVNATTAIGDTSRSNVVLNRGAVTRENDKYVRRGEGWISLTSPLEGTSYVNVVAPEIHNWDARRKTAVVHWVDAAAQYPPPAINPAGTKHVFTTTVVHSSNQSPCENWIVRYEIVDGPPAGFLPSGATSAEVRTNPAGQASVEIIEKVPASGVNKIAIQVIRPADVPGSGGQRLVVFRNGTTTKTWSAPDLAVHVDISNRRFQSRRSAGQGRDGRRGRARRTDVCRRQSGRGSCGPAASLAARRSWGPTAAADRSRFPFRKAGQHRPLLRCDGGRRIEGPRLRHDDDCVGSTAADRAAGRAGNAGGAA